MPNNFEYNNLSSTTKDNSRKILFITKIIDKNTNIWRQKKSTHNKKSHCCAVFWYISREKTIYQ